MRVHLAHHASDGAFAAELVRVMAAHRFEACDAVEGSDVVVLLVSRAALREGLGDRPRAVLEAGVPVVTALLGDDTVPDRFPVARKHVPLVRDVASALRLLEDHRRTAAARIAEGKREIFGLGVLLALLQRA